MPKRKGLGGHRTGSDQRRAFGCSSEVVLDDEGSTFNVCTCCLPKRNAKSPCWIFAMQYFAYCFYVFISLMIWGWGRSNLMQPWKQLFFSSSCYQGSPDSVTRMLGSTIGYEVTGDHDNAIKKQHVVLNIDRSWIPGSATISILFFASLKQSRFQTHCLASLQKNMFPVPDDMNNYKLTKKSLHIVSNKLGHVDTALCILHSIYLVSLVSLNP